MPDFDHLPTLLAGPILRRVEPTSVSVWVATSVASMVEVGVWEGATATTAGFFGNGTAAHRGSAPTIRLGPKLHLALVTLDLTATPLVPGVNYAYNVAFDGVEDLSTLTLLEDSLIEPTHLALGYVPGRLPGFALPPLEIENLHLAHGSCRKPHGFGADGLAALDLLIARTHENALGRPHQLFLTGDQIYADDVAAGLLPQLTVAGNTLLGVVETLPFGAGPGIKATPENLLTGWRQEVTRQIAHFSSNEASSHLLSFAEFCAMYLFAWSNVLWSEMRTADEVLGTEKDTAKAVAALPDGLKSLYEKVDKETLAKARDDLRKAHTDEQTKDVEVFRKGLPQVRRALANVPTYMIFDDHEITDDWYLAQDWRDRVLSTPLGATIIRNGLLSYTLFQGWGNDPARFTGPTDEARVLSLAKSLFTGGTPAVAVANQLDQIFGLGGTAPTIAWHYKVPTGPTTTVVLDTRTRRSFAGRFEPPGLLSQPALDLEFPASLPVPAGGGALIVVSPAPVLGLALIEDLFQPLMARGKSDFYLGLVKGRQPAVSGYLDFDLEAWALDPARFEAFLARCSEFDKVVLLSGDVHFASSVEMDYWRLDRPGATRIVQLTSSALKNAWQGTVKPALETTKVQRLMQAANYPALRLGWDSPIDLEGHLHVVGGLVPRARRALLRRVPTVIPADNWPTGTQIDVPAKWAWRVRLVKDERTDEPVLPTDPARPPEGHSAPVAPDVVPTPVGATAGYVAVLKRAEQQLKTKIARAAVFASQFGIVTFDAAATAVNHSLMYVHPAGLKPPDPQAYTAHAISLAPTADPLPTITTVV
ncbi:DUF7800 domain-containing protein [Streptomyces sp. NPDC002143]